MFAEGFGKVSLTFMTLDIYRRARVLTDSQLLPAIGAKLMTGCVKKHGFWIARYECR